ncbi:MAG TPA: hypothetical protein ENN34_03495 [Deltaproteobacteria bacterium]|nr:hypothetical protein [Deltaproteobacteria bacterium]
MARIITQSIEDTQGREAGISIAARIFLVAGFAGIPVGAVLTIASARFTWLVLGVGCMLMGVSLYLILISLAEIIRLLKKLCGFPYSGVISGTGTGTIAICSECSSLVWRNSTTCSSCGADLDAGEGETSLQEEPRDQDVISGEEQVTVREGQDEEQEQGGSLKRGEP